MEQRCIICLETLVTYGNNVYSHGNTSIFHHSKAICSNYLYSHILAGAIVNHFIFPTYLSNKDIPSSMSLLYKDTPYKDWSSYYLL